MKYTESAIQVFVPKNYFILFFHKRSCQNHSLIMPSSFPFLQLSLHYRNTIISNQLRPTIIFILSLKINCRLLAMLIKITFITISSSTQQALLTITSMFPISGATTNSAESIIVSAMKMDLPPVCRPEKKAKAIKRTWNIIVAPVNYVSQLIRQSGLPSTMRNFCKRCN